jgi:magnesium transporter
MCNGCGPDPGLCKTGRERAAKLIQRLKIDEHTLASSLDPDELARLESEPKHAVANFKRPRYFAAADQFLFTVQSVGAFLLRDRLIVMLPEKMAIFDGAQVGRLHDLASGRFPADDPPLH